MTENDRKWKKMKEKWKTSERKWRKMKNWKKKKWKKKCKKVKYKKKMKKWKNGKNEKMKKNEKWKKMKKMKKWKKTNKKCRKMMKKERKMKKWIHTQNLRRFPGFTVVVVTFSSKSSTISMILFRKVSLSRGKSTTRFGRWSFFRRKVTSFIGRETKRHMKSTKNR